MYRAASGVLLSSHQAGQVPDSPLLGPRDAIWRDSTKKPKAVRLDDFRGAFPRFGTATEASRLKTQGWEDNIRLCEAMPRFLYPSCWWHFEYDFFPHSLARHSKKNSQMCFSSAQSKARTSQLVGIRLVQQQQTHTVSSHYWWASDAWYYSVPPLRNRLNLTIFELSSQFWEMYAI